MKITNLKINNLWKETLKFEFRIVYFNLCWFTEMDAFGVCYLFPVFWFLEINKQKDCDVELTQEPSLCWDVLAFYTFDTVSSIVILRLVLQSRFYCFSMKNHKH